MDFLCFERALELGGWCGLPAECSGYFLSADHFSKRRRRPSGMFCYSDSQQWTGCAALHLIALQALIRSTTVSSHPKQAWKVINRADALPLLPLLPNQQSFHLKAVRCFQKQIYPKLQPNHQTKPQYPQEISGVSNKKNVNDFPLRSRVRKAALTSGK